MDTSTDFTSLYSSRGFISSPPAELPESPRRRPRPLSQVFVASVTSDNLLSSLFSDSLHMPRGTRWRPPPSPAESRLQGPQGKAMPGEPLLIGVDASRPDVVCAANWLIQKDLRFPKAGLPRGLHLVCWYHRPGLSAER